MRAAALAVLLLAGAASAARADAGWFESGDVALRLDLQVLNDAEIIRLPLNQWPLPRAAVRYALANSREQFATNAAVRAALARVRARLDAIDGARRDKRGFTFGTSLSAGEPALLRQFETIGREAGELSAFATYGGERAEVSLRVTGAADPQDDRSVRADGSHATVRLGNWLLSANTLERYWGPAHESSLILSNNARPMPTVMVERATAKPFESRWLSWLGPWRMSFGISQMESQRQDIDSPLFMAWRVEIMPLKSLEIGFSRTAQFCGEQLECNLDVFGNLLAGNDNVGIDATPENEPGNQMAGFDMRWASPIGNLPYALYSQYIGEDESSYLPAKYLGQIGAEVWKPLANGGLVQAYAEWADTTCSATGDRGPYFDCSYNQGRFNVEGYRYYGRVIGHTTDRDSASYALGAVYITPGGETWSVTARAAELNRDGGIDVRNSVSQVRADYNALELGWRGRVFGENVDVSLGAESLEPVGAERDVQPFGFIRWSHQFRP